LLALAFIGLGLTCVLAKIGRPFRAMNVVLNPQTSWMTREGLIAGPLFIAGLAAAWFDQVFVYVLAAFIAMVFLYCQGKILTEAKGIPAWRTPKSIPLFMSTGIVEGAGIFLIASLFLNPEDMSIVRPVILALLLISIVSRVFTWRIYLRDLQESGAPKKALNALEKADGPITFIGNILPVLLLLVSQLVPESAVIAALVSGILAFATGWYLKFVIINKAAFNQGFAIPFSPARGGGKPGPGTKPGWRAPKP
ncbi:MAG: phenylacetyl-CoA:acceptor oxidoreductase, partial [Alphaproteobacteria bacterium]|nr:phenylacetyl-CoA:acceptor oxidoreductase [Alphaproteobacteria bacterium]